jgi:ABC-type dipeptide/oligopeptide/nickel transport system, ATPase component
MLLEVKDLSLSYGDKKVLKNVSFSLNRGEVLCIVGESGSGKSSILLSIMGLLPKNAS